MPTRKTIVVPCMVNSRLNVAGLTNVLWGKKSWARISRASIPATTRKISPYPMYIMPSFL